MSEDPEPERRTGSRGRAGPGIPLALGLLILSFVADAQQPAKTPWIGFLAHVSLAARDHGPEAKRLAPADDEDAVEDQRVEMDVEVESAAKPLGDGQAP